MSSLVNASRSRCRIWSFGMYRTSGSASIRSHNWHNALDHWNVGYQHILLIHQISQETCYFTEIFVIGSELSSQNSFWRILYFCKRYIILPISFLVVLFFLAILISRNPNLAWAEKGLAHFFLTKQQAHDPRLMEDYMVVLDSANPTFQIYKSVGFSFCGHGMILWSQFFFHAVAQDVIGMTYRKRWCSEWFRTWVVNLVWSWQSTCAMWIWRLASERCLFCIAVEKGMVFQLVMWKLQTCWKSETRNSICCINLE